MNANIMYFCTQCKNRPITDDLECKCEIEHTVKIYSKNEHIAYQNDIIRHLLLLSKGRVKTEIASDLGLVVPMEEIVAPYPLAAAFLFADDNRFPVDIIAAEKCEILLIKKENIERQMASCVGFMRGFLAFSANRMKYLSERIKLFAQRSIKAKMAYFILSHEKQGEFQLNCSITWLAEYFGVERPSLSRAISEMVRDKIIIYKLGKGRILDVDAMHDLLI